MPIYLKEKKDVGFFYKLQIIYMTTILQNISLNMQHLKKHISMASFLTTVAEGNLINDQMLNGSLVLHSPLPTYIRYDVVCST